MAWADQLEDQPFPQPPAQVGALPAHPPVEFGVTVGWGGNRWDPAPPTHAAPPKLELFLLFLQEPVEDAEKEDKDKKKEEEE